MSANHEIFTQFLNEVFGQEETILKHEAEDGGPPVWVFVYRDVVEPGSITGVTYGLSHFKHPDWISGSRPELIVSMKSRDIAWASAAAYFAASFRGEKRFSYGDVFTTDGPLAEDTLMDGFFLFAQSILDMPPPHLQLNDFQVSFSQLYPIHRSELPLYSEIGLEAFWKHPGFDLDDPKRAAIGAH